MKTKGLFLFALLFGLLLNVHAADNVSGNGKLTTKSITIDDFNEVRIDGLMDFNYQQSDDANNLEITLDENLHQYIKIDINNRVLVVGFDKKVKVNKLTKFIVKSNSKWLKKVRVSGNANFMVNTKLEGDELEEVDFDLDDLRKSLRETEKLPTLYIQRTLRSGQSITSDGNIVIIGDANPGSEIIAKGDITVWGILGGIAHAGAEGNQYARIRALKMNAIQLRIADIFARRPDNINIPYIQKTDTFVPEEACIRKKQIIIHKIHEA